MVVPDLKMLTIGMVSSRYSIDCVGKDYMSLVILLILFCFQITCKVKAKFTNHPLHPWSDHVAIQQPFFAGINVRRNIFTPLLTLGRFKKSDSGYGLHINVCYEK